MAGTLAASAGRSGAGGVERRDIVATELDLHRLQDLGQLPETGSTHDRCSYARPRHQPGQRHLRGRRGMARGHVIERLQDAQAARVEKVLDAWRARRAFSKIALRAIFAGEKAGRERVVGDDADPLPDAVCFEITLKCGAVVEIVAWLQVFIARWAEPLAAVQRGLQARGAD